MPAIPPVDVVSATPDQNEPVLRETLKYSLGVDALLAARVHRTARAARCHSG
jgi:hypothetical protein